jgi:hypothetical protein
MRMRMLLINLKQGEKRRFLMIHHSLLAYHEALYALQEVQQYQESKPNSQG